MENKFATPDRTVDAITNHRIVLIESKKLIQPKITLRYKTKY